MATLSKQELVDIYGLLESVRNLIDLTNLLRSQVDELTELATKLAQDKQQQRQELYELHEAIKIIRQERGFLSPYGGE